MQTLSIPPDSGYPLWHYQPLRLMKEELQNPVAVIAQFFSAYRLPEVRQDLKEMLEDAISSSEGGATSHFNLYNELEKLVEAAWLLWQEQKEVETEKPAIQPGNTKDAFSAILDLLVTAIQPERIFLLSSEENKSIDLLIIVPDNNGKSFTHYGTLAEIVCYGIPEVTFSLHLASEMVRHIEACHPFWLSACTENKQIYCKDNLPLPVPAADKKQKEEERRRTVFHTGLSKAAFFWQSAQPLAEESPAMALFMLHQSAELTLRALIRSLTGTEIKEHSIRILQKHLRRCAPAIMKVFPDNTEREKALLTLLDSAYLKGRYADNFSPEKEDVHLLLQKVGFLQDTADDIFTATLAFEEVKK